MAVYLVKSTDPGAPSLTGQNGSGTTVFDYILNTVGGLTIQDTATNKRNYVLPNGDIYHCVHDNTVTGQAYLMVVRPCESASAIDTLVDPYPTTGLVTDANCNFRVSSTADATARPWWAVLDTSATTGCFYFWSEYSTGGFVSGLWWAGGTEISALPVDNYAAISYQRNSSSTSTAGNVNIPHGFLEGLGSSLGRTYLKRTQDGSIKSPYCGGLSMGVSSSSTLGSINNGPAIPHPVDGKVRMTSVAVNDSYAQSGAAATGAEAVRLWVPRLFNPMHAVNVYASINCGDTWADSSYGASAKFIFFKVGNSSGVNGAMIVQYDGDWVRPGG